MKQAILGAVPGEYKDWLEDELKYANEPTLRTRLSELISEHRDVLAENIPDIESFEALVVNTRNNLTHPSAATRKAIATGVELEIINAYLQMLLELCFLNELGLQRTRQEWLLLFPESARQRIPSVVKAHRAVQATMTQTQSSPRDND